MAQAYLTDGIAALDIKKQSGRPCALTPKQKQQLKDYVCKHAVKDEGGRLIGEDIREYIRETFDVQYKLNNVYRLLHELNLSWITSRSKHPKQSIDAQERFKKFHS
ncbi:MAG: helix-turn-helix domain-containing protein [Pseudoalteromonas prydzensis]|uniref:helix-turn-helix domain-containing protein n=1 Tax=Pseudoalteromonas prydzensis TaxID=182141 RepID=UPI003F94BBCD